MIRTDFTWDSDVENRGAGLVGRNTVANTTILPQVRSCQQQKTITMDLAVGTKRDSRKKTTVPEDIQDIVGNAGNFTVQDDSTDLESSEAPPLHVV